MTIFYAELGVFLHDNTNITRLAEDLRGIPLRSSSCCTYYLNSGNKKLNRLYLFKGSEYISYSKNDEGHFHRAGIQHDYVTKWPFQWGSGNLDAAYYQSEMNTTFLFRGTDYLELSSEASIDSIYPKAISLPWPEHIWGNPFNTR